MVEWTKVFADDATFAAHHAAKDWLEARGYSVGRMCGDLPIGVLRGEFDIQKVT